MLTVIFFSCKSSITYVTLTWRCTCAFAPPHVYPHCWVCTVSHSPFLASLPTFISSYIFLCLSCPTGTSVACTCRRGQDPMGLCICMCDSVCACVCVCSIPWLVIIARRSRLYNKIKRESTKCTKREEETESES